MSKPHEVIVFTVDEVLLDIYDGNLGSVDTDTATKAFAQWLVQHDAYYHPSKVASLHDNIAMGVLEAIKKGKRVVVVPSTPPDEEEIDESD